MELEDQRRVHLLPAAQSPPAHLQAPQEGQQDLSQEVKWRQRFSRTPGAETRRTVGETGSASNEAGAEDWSGDTGHQAPVAKHAVAPQHCQDDPSPWPPNPKAWKQPWVKKCHRRQAGVVFPSLVTALTGRSGQCNQTLTLAT